MILNTYYTPPAGFCKHFFRKFLIFFTKSCPPAIFEAAFALTYLPQATYILFLGPVKKSGHRIHFIIIRYSLPVPQFFPCGVFSMTLQSFAQGFKNKNQKFSKNFYSFHINELRATSDGRRVIFSAQMRKFVQ